MDQVTATSLWIQEAVTEMDQVTVTSAQIRAVLHSTSIGICLGCTLNQQPRALSLSILSHFHLILSVFESGHVLHTRREKEKYNHAQLGPVLFILLHLIISAVSRSHTPVTEQSDAMHGWHQDAIFRGNARARPARAFVQATAYLNEIY
jgi:hypothetical protein